MIPNNNSEKLKILRERITEFYNRMHQSLMKEAGEKRARVFEQVVLILFLLCVVGIMDTYVSAIALANALGLLTSQNHPVVLFGILPVTAVIGFFIAILVVETWTAYFINRDHDAILPSHKKSNHRVWLSAALTLSTVVAVIEGLSIYGFRMLQNQTIELLFATAIPVIFLIARIIVAYKQAKWVVDIKNNNGKIKAIKEHANEMANRHDEIQAYIENDYSDKYLHLPLEDVIRFIKGEISLDQLHELIQPEPGSPKPDQQIAEKDISVEEHKDKIGYIYVKDVQKTPSKYTDSPYNNGFTKLTVPIMIASLFLLLSMFFTGCVKSQDPDSIHLIVAYDASLSMAQDQELQCLNNFIGKTGTNLDSHLRITFIIFGAKPMILFSDLAGKKFSAAESTILSMLHKQPRSWKEKTDLVAAMQAVNTEINLEQSENQNKYIYTSLFVITDGKDDPNNTNPVIIPEQRLQDIARLLTQISGKVNKIIIFQIDPNVLLQYQPYVNNLFSAGKLVTEAQNPGDDLCKQLDLPEVWNVPRIHY